MRRLQFLRRLILLLTVTLLLYFSISFLLLFFPANASHRFNTPDKNRTIYLFHDFAHTEIIFPVDALSKKFKAMLSPFFDRPDRGYFAFSYGDEAFMLHTPRWRDTDPVLACRALCLNTPGVIRVGHYPAIRRDSSVIALPADRAVLRQAENEIQKSFLYQNGAPIPVQAPKYSPYIRYFKATEPYNLFYTCNTWSGEVLRKAGYPISYWTPLAFEVVFPFVKSLSNLVVP